MNLSELNAASRATALASSTIDPELLKIIQEDLDAPSRGMFLLLDIGFEHDRPIEDAWAKTWGAVGADVDRWPVGSINFGMSDAPLTSPPAATSAEAEEEEQECFVYLTEQEDEGEDEPPKKVRDHTHGLLLLYSY